MAKDRFSRFNRNNWDTGFKYGYDSINYKPISDRKDLSPMQEKFLIELCDRLKNPYGIEFILSVLEVGKEPTEKQKQIIKEIIKNE